MIFRLLRLSITRNRIGKVPTMVNQKVTLREDSGYAPEEATPMEGTSYECGGTIVIIDRRGETATVLWSNNYRGNFRLRHLRVISKKEFDTLLKSGFVADNPNLTFKQKKLSNNEGWGVYQQQN